MNNITEYIVADITSIGEKFPNVTDVDLESTEMYKNVIYDIKKEGCNCCVICL